MKTFSAKRTAVYIFGLTILSKCFGFLREVVLANSFGTGYVTDAYVLSTSIPGMLFGGILGAIGTAYMPVYSRVAENSSDGNKFTSRLITVIEAVALISAACGLVFAPQITGLIAKKFSPQALELCTFYTRVTFSFAVFTSAKGILDSFLRYRNIFIPQMFGDYLQNICVITAILISAKTDNRLLVFGLFFGYFASTSVTYFIARKEKYRFKPSFSLNDDIKEVCRIALPVFLSAELSNINSFVDRFLATGLVSGSIAALSFGNIIATFAITTTASIITTVMYPKITKDATNGDWNHYNNTCSRCITMNLLIVIPFTLGFLVFSNEIIQVLYERGSFGGNSTSLTATALFMYSFMLPFSAVNSTVSQMSYSLQDSKTPFVCSFVAIPTNIILDLILVRRMAHAGLALATSISAAVSMIMLCIIFSTKHKTAKLHIDVKKIVLIVLSSCVAVGLAKPFYHFINRFVASRTLLLGFSGCFAVVVYLSILILSKVDELKEIIGK